MVEGGKARSVPGFSDNAGRLTGETTDFGAFEKTQAYTWTADGLKTTVTNPEGITYTYGWTALHQPDAVTIPGHGSIASLGYDWQASNGWMYPGGTQHKQEHDAFLRLAKQRLTDPAQVVKQGADYQYDAASNITAITKHERSAQTEGELAQSPATYGYDALDRLTSVSKTTTTNTTRTENYQYDAVGNRINSTGTDTVDGSYTHNANHALTNLDVSAGEGGDEGEEEPGTWTFQYNANGAITQKAFTPTGATAPTKTWTYGWNRQNRLSTVHYNGAHIASYAYDPFGRRIKKSVHSSITGGTTGTTYYLYNDSGLVAEYTQTGQLNTEYHYVPGSHWSTNPLFARDGQTGEIYYAATDQLGTATALIKSSGQIVWRAEKTAFGKTTVTAENNNAGKPVRFNLRFPGQYEDTETGLHYNWMRYYDAEAGRYVREDPIGLRGGLNLYNYVNGGPINSLDPYGLRGTGAAIGAAAGAIIGGTVGALSGLAAGAAGGTLIAPGVGTLGGAGVGAWEGGIAGAAVGGIVGGLLGDAIEDFINHPMWNEPPDDDSINIDPDKPIPPQLPGYIDPDSTYPTTEAQSCPVDGGPPLDPRERCFNGVALKFGQCMNSSTPKAVCHIQRAIGLLMCSAQSPDSD